MNYAKRAPFGDRFERSLKVLKTSRSFDFKDSMTIRLNACGREAVIEAECQAVLWRDLLN